MGKRRKCHEGIGPNTVAIRAGGPTKLKIKPIFIEKHMWKGRKKEEQEEDEGARGKGSGGEEKRREGPEEETSERGSIIIDIRIILITIFINFIVWRPCPGQ